MDAASPQRPDAGLALSRRRLLHLAGVAGLTAAALGACSEQATAGSSPSPTSTATTPASPPASPVGSPPPMPATTTAPGPTPASRVLLCREAWGAAPARPGGTTHDLTRMTVHHTAAVLGDNSNAPARLRQHQRYHQDSQGWIDIAYHISVDRNGNIYQLRDPALVGDTATSYDPTGHFLVVCEGNFDEEQVTEEQLNGAALAFAWAARQFGIPTATLAAHRDASADTACPGANLYAHVTSGDLRRRIEDLVLSGTADLPIVCGPEAVEKVAAIEAG